MNGLLRLDPVFDELIDHPRVLPYLEEFVGLPQLINTWSISKFEGAVHSGWHRGVPVSDYSYFNGEIRSRMFNVVWFLTDNGPDDGCIVALPGSHKSNFDLPFGDYEGLELPGAQALTGKAGDLLMFSETVVHNGLLKTTPGTRSNLYFNYVHAHYNVMTREPINCHHFYLPAGDAQEADAEAARADELDGARPLGVLMRGHSGGAGRIPQRPRRNRAAAAARGKADQPLRRANRLTGHPSTGPVSAPLPPGRRLAGRELHR